MLNTMRKCFGVVTVLREHHDAYEHSCVTRPSLTLALSIAV